MFKKYNLISILLIILFYNSAFAGVTGILRGYTLHEDNTPVPFTAVLISELNIGTETDENGYFSIMNIPVGNYTVKFTRIGYSVQIIENVHIKADSHTELNAVLKQTDIEGEELIVQAEKPMIDAQVTYSADYRTEEELEIQAIDDLDDVISLTAGVVDGHFRGGREDQVSYTIDGVNINNPITGIKEVEPPITMLEAVDVITGVFNAEYGDAISGVVNAAIKSGDDILTVEAGSSIAVKDNKYAKSFTRTVVDSAYLVYDQNFNVTDTVIKTHPETLKEGKDQTARNFYANISGPLFTKKVKFFIGFEADLTPSAVPDLDNVFSYTIPDYKGKKLNTVQFQNSYSAWAYDYQYYYAANYDNIDNPNKELGRFLFYFPDYRDEYVKLYHNNIAAADDFLDNQKYSGAAKVTFNLTDLIKISGAYQYIYQNEMPHREDGIYILNESDRKNFHFMPFSYLREEKISNIAVLSSTISFNSSAFLDLKFSAAKIESKNGGYDYDNDKWVYDDYVKSGKNKSIYDELYEIQKILQNKKADALYDFYNYFWHYSSVRYHEEMENTTYTFKSDFTWQIIDKKGLRLRLKSGLKTDVFDSQNDIMPGSYPLFEDITGSYSTGNSWDLSPKKYAFYIQNTLEYSGLILNAGVRAEIFDPNGEYFDDPTAVNPNIIKTDKKFMLSPRLGISHPISDKSIFFFNYAHMYKNPNLELLYYNYLIPAPTNQFGFYMGNPDLEPEKSVLYELGYDQQIGSSIITKMRIFYKELNNMVSVRTEFPYSFDSFGSTTFNTYTQFTSEDYGSIYGVELSFEKRLNDFWGFWLSYTYSTVKGSAADPFRNVGLNEFLISKKEIELDYDRPHVLNMNIGLRIPENTFGTQFIDGWETNFNLNYSSGLPYTKQRYMVYGHEVALEKVGETNGYRMPEKFLVNMKLTKNFVLFDLDWRFYTQVYNLFNRRNVTEVYEITGKYDEEITNYNIPFGNPDVNARQLQQYYDKFEWMRKLRMETPDHYEDLREIKIGFEIRYQDRKN